MMSLVLTLALTASEWTLLYEEAGIKMFSAKHAAFPTFKAEGEIPVNLLDLLAVIADVKHRKEWLTDIRLSRIVEGNVDSRVIIYEQFAMPWPVSNRDCVVESVIEKDFDEGIVTVRFHQVNHSAMPDAAGYVRMPVIRGLMRYSYIDATRTFAEYETTLDVGGSLPRWMIALATKKVPIFTLQALIKQVGKTQGRYDAFVREQRAKLKFKE